MTVDDKRDKKKLGLALITVPVAIISPGLELDVDSAAAAQPNKPDQTKSVAGPAAPSTGPSSQIAKSPQLTYTVKSGDTVSSIAKKFQLSSNQLLSLNGLKANDFIFPGQKLKLVDHAVVDSSVSAANVSTLHTVRAGDTVNSIAKKYSIPVRTILAMNKLSTNALIFPGQKLIIGNVVKQAPKKQIPSFHVVELGETLASVAKKYGIKLNDLLAANSLSESSLIYSGQKLNLKPNAQNSAPAAPESGLAAGVKTPSNSVNAGAISSDPHRPSSVCQIHGYHTVKAGESVSKIAAVYGVSTQSVLNQNSLTWTSTIFIGQKLIIPGVHEIQFCPDITKLTAEMKSNAQVIFDIGRSLGVSDYGIVIALATSMQESGLKNLSYGDRDSVGLFQQRPSAHWGSAEQIMNTEYAARAFYGGPSSPTFGAARGLLDIRAWSDMTLTQAAQSVQISAYPNAYAKWEASAWVWLDELNGAVVND
ncbi:MAG: LysM peptidoglycan-binding domain-containing protein [Rhodoluna sp.]